MPKPEATTILTRCHYCNAEIYAQSDNPYPECNDCDKLSSEAWKKSLEIERTFYALTQHVNTKE